MNFSFSSLLRLLVLMAVGTTILAVGLSRLDPPKPGWRMRRPVRHTNINEYFLEVTDRTPRWLDVETGQVTAHALNDGDVLEAASCAPWMDEQGRGQMVGRWSSRTKDGPKSMSSDFGLARYSFPGGEMLDQVSTEIVPVSPPCWFPGTCARILFAAGDGKLYHYAFEPEAWIKGADPDAKRDSRPRPLTWRCPKPGTGNVFISDLSWPDDPRMGGCVLVALREQEKSSSGSRCYSRTQLWWLKLNFAGTEIVETGRLVTPDVSGAASKEMDERSPAVATMKGGRLVMAYLRQRVGMAGWELRLVPIEIDAGRQVPRAFESASQKLSVRCQAAHPAFSNDGQWLNAIAGPSASDSRVTRISTAGLLPPSK